MEYISIFGKGMMMGRAYRPRPTALIVGQNIEQLDLLSVLLEECGLKVMHCDRTEVASEVMSGIGESVLILFTTVDLAGAGEGADLVDDVARRWPHVHLVALGKQPAGRRRRRLPSRVRCLQRPRPLDILIEAGRAVDAPDVRH